MGHIETIDLGPLFYVVTDTESRNSATDEMVRRRLMPESSLARRGLCCQNRRCAMANRNFVCFECRASRRYDPLYGPPLCTQCGNAMIRIYCSVPKKRDAKGWIDLRKELSRLRRNRNTSAYFNRETLR
jgi:hypothetical protein